MNYKYSTWILAVIVVVLGIAFFMKGNEPVAETFDTISERITKCRVDLATWSAANPKTASTSAKAAAELDSIMEACQNTIIESRNDVGGKDKPQ